MYNDILFSGGRSFATCMVNSKTGCFAETAMVFYLDELKVTHELRAAREALAALEARVAEMQAERDDAAADLARSLA